MRALKCSNAAFLIVFIFIGFGWPVEGTKKDRGEKPDYCHSLILSQVEKKDSLSELREAILKAEEANQEYSRNLGIINYLHQLLWEIDTSFSYYDPAAYDVRISQKDREFLLRFGLSIQIRGVHHVHRNLPMDGKGTNRSLYLKFAGKKGIEIGAQIFSNDNLRENLWPCFSSYTFSYGNHYLIYDWDPPGSEMADSIWIGTITRSSEKQHFHITRLDEFWNDWVEFFPKETSQSVLIGSLIRMMAQTCNKMTENPLTLFLNQLIG